MIEFKKISLEDKTLFDTYLTRDFFYISDISFGNLYIWHCARDISYAIIEDCLIIQTQYPQKNPFYFYPIGNGNKIQAIKILFEYSQTQKQALEFHSLENKNIQELQENFTKISIIPNRDRSDYIYSIKELIELSGRKYHKKKNHLNQFLQTYPNFKYTSIDKNNKLKVLETWKKWFLQMEKEITEGLKNENIGIINALNHYENLGFKGGFVSIEDEIIGFSFGEIINNEMVVIHIEKANPQYHGAYQIINQQLLFNEFKDYTYANREEDLGIEGLRRAKMSYNPVFLIEKFEAIFQG